MTGKREPPLKLDIPFGEALTRFARASPAEIAPVNPHPKLRKQRMGRQAQPFKFTLLPVEVEQIMGAEIVGTGGLQTLLRDIQDQLALGNVVKFDDEELGKLIRYITRYDPNGGFELRLRRAFLRSIYGLFATELAI